MNKQMTVDDLISALASWRGEMPVCIVLEDNRRAEIASVEWADSNTGPVIAIIPEPPK